MPLQFIALSVFLFFFNSVGVELLRTFGFIEYPFFSKGDVTPQVYIMGIVSSFSYLASMLIFCRLSSLQFSVRPGLIDLSHRPNHSIIILSLFASTLVILTTLAFYWSDLSAIVSARHSTAHRFDRLILLASTICFIGLIRANVVLRLLAYCLLAFSASVPFAIGASRSVTIPFIIAAICYFGTKNRFFGSIFLYAAIAALLTAFETRGYPSFYVFFSEFGTNLRPDKVLAGLPIILQYSLSGLQTMDLAATAPGTFSFTNVASYIAWLSPVPSDIFPPDFVGGMSLSYLIGVEPQIFGLNYDLYSEGIWWFGISGVALHPIAVAFFTTLPFITLKQLYAKPSGLLYTLAYAPVLIMLLGGNVFPLRAGSRFIYLFIIGMLALKIGPKLLRKWRQRSDNHLISSKFPISL